jgi:hypothetical protein
MYVCIYREREKGHKRNMRQNNYLQNSKEMAWKTNLANEDTVTKA